MGRPPITLTGDQRREVETLAAVLSQEQIADYFGIARNTFRAICERDAEVDALYKRGKARAIGAIAQSLITKARAGDTASMIFFLKTQAGWRETSRLEAREDRARDVTDLARLSDEELTRMIGTLDEIIEAERGRAAALTGETLPAREDDP